MRTVIGWMAAMLASALLGAAVYQTVLSKPLPELDPVATVESVTRQPTAGPTLYRTEVRTVVEPTPTITVEEQVVVQEESVAVSQPPTSDPAPTRTGVPRSTQEREDDAEDRDDDESDEPDDESDEPEDEESDSDEPEDSDDSDDDA